MTRKAEILIIGSYGRGNIGDDAFLLAAIRLFKDYELVINSADDCLLPAEVRGKVTTIATHGSQGLLKKLLAFARVRRIVYWGGDLWVQLYGERFPNASLYKMLLLNLLARLSGKQVFYVGTGVGQLRGYPLWLAQRSAALAQVVAVREPESARILGLSRTIVLSDLAVNIANPQEKSVLHKPFVIGVAPLFYVPHPDVKFPKLMDDLAAFICGLPTRQFKVILFPMLVSSDSRDDLWAARQLQARCKDHDVTILEDRDIGKYIQALGGVNLMIGVRLHAAIFAALAGTPCIGVAYRPKVRRFFEMNDIAQYCLDLDEVSHLPHLFWSMHSNYHNVKDQFVEVCKSNRRKKIAYQRFIKKYF